MSKIDLNDVAGGFNLSKINDNFQKIETALNDGALWRDNPDGEPNQMLSDLDMNGKRIYNLPEPVAEHEPARYKEFKEAQEAIEQSHADAQRAKDEADRAKYEADRAEAAAGSSDASNLKVFDTKAEAEAAAATLPDGQVVDVYSENKRYRVRSGLLEFYSNLDELRDDLEDRNGSAIVGYVSSVVGAANRDVLAKLRETVTILDIVGDGVFPADATAAASALLSSGATLVDFLGIETPISSGLVVPAGVTAVGLNIKLLNTVDRVLSLGTGARVFGKITGSNPSGASIETGIYPLGDVSHDVVFDIEVTKLAVGAQIGLSQMCRNWSGVLRAKDLSGGGAESNGYACLMPAAVDCNIVVFSENTPRHCLYLSAGSSRNNCVLFSKGSGNLPVILASYENQNWTEQNNITAFVSDCVQKPGATASPNAGMVVGKARQNKIKLFVNNEHGNLPRAFGYRALSANAAPTQNDVEIQWLGPWSGEALVESESGINNFISISGSGASTLGSLATLILSTNYQGIIPVASKSFTLKLKELQWDANGSNTCALAAYDTIAPMDIGADALVGFRNSSALEFVRGTQRKIGFSYSERGTSGDVTIPGGQSGLLTVSYLNQYKSEVYPSISMISPGASEENLPAWAIISLSVTGFSVLVKNPGSTPQRYLLRYLASGD